MLPINLYQRMVGLGGFCLGLCTQYALSDLGSKPFALSNGHNLLCNTPTQMNLQKKKNNNPN